MLPRIETGQLICTTFWSAFSPHFPAFGLNMERYSVPLRILPNAVKCRKNADQNNPEYGLFLRAASSPQLYVHLHIKSFSFENSLFCY